MKQKLKKVVQFLLNPRLLLCVGIAWIITNGWSYILLAIGTWLGNGWMIGVASAYLAFLWLPISPEKLVTFAISIALLRWLFPDDQKTLAILKEGYAKVKKVFRERKEKKEAEKSSEQAAAPEDDLK